MAEIGTYGDAVFVSVEKEGFRRPLPQVAQLYIFRNEKLHFELDELPEAFAARQRAAGLVPFEGNWVDPAAEGLAEYKGQWMPKNQAVELDSRARGLVKYGDRWVTPEEARQLLAVDEKAKGKIEFKGRWVTPEVAETERGLDREVDAIFKQKNADLLPPKVVGRLDAAAAQVQLFNGTGQDVRIILSGPTTKERHLAPYESFGLRSVERFLLEPGRYRIVVIPSGSGLSAQTSGTIQLADPILKRVDSRTAVTEEPLTAGFQYSLTYNGGREEKIGTLKDYTPTAAELPPDLPKVDVPNIEVPEKQPGDPSSPSTPAEPPHPPGRGGRPRGR